MKTTKRIKPNISQNVDIALNSPVHKENLPLPYVFYPNHYGTFFCFSDSENSDLFFCECSKKAIDNHFNLRSHETNSSWSDNKMEAHLSSRFFPNIISQKSLEVDSIDSVLRFKPKLCHRCNLITPSLRYCHEMYGGNFKQFYGWYLNQTGFRLGIRLRDGSFIENYTPQNYIEKIQEIQEISNRRNLLIKQSDSGRNVLLSEIRELEKIISKQQKAIEKAIENITRQEFGFRKVGEGNVSETILTQIIEQIYKDSEILKHYRPKWLEGLEIDVYLPKENIGVEYQGQQHFHPVKAWGGEKALLELRKRDERKRKICNELGVKLIEVDYTEPLEINYIKRKISNE